MNRWHRIASGLIEPVEDESLICRAQERALAIVVLVHEFDYFDGAGLVQYFLLEEVANHDGSAVIVDVL